MSNKKTTASLILKCSISSNGEFAAVCMPDGVIKFYDTLSSSVKQEFKFSEDSSSCPCLSWSVHGSNKRSSIISSNQQKNNKSSEAMPQAIESELNDLNLIAIGKADGVILLYCLKKTTLYSKLAIFLIILIFTVISFLYHQSLNYFYFKN